MILQIAYKILLLFVFNTKRIEINTKQINRLKLKEAKKIINIINQFPYYIESQPPHPFSTSVKEISIGQKCK